MKLVARWRQFLGRRGTAGAIVLLIGLLGMAAAPVLDGSQAHYVHIRWHPAVTAEQQTRFEWQHGLRRRSGEGRSFGYDIVNESSWNIRLLLDNPFVEDSQDLDAGRSAVADTAPLGKARSGLAWRWGLEGYVPVVAARARGAFLVGLLLLCVSRPMVRGFSRMLRLLPDVRQRKARRALGLGFAAAGVLLLAARPMLDGAPSRMVAVRWVEGTSPDTREAREAQYGLRAQSNEGRTFFTYDLVNDSAANVRAIAADRAIVSVGGIDRVRGVVLPGAAEGRSRTGLAWRWRWEACLAPMGVLERLLLAVGLGLLIGWAPIKRAGTGLAFLAGALPAEAQGAWAEAQGARAWMVRHAAVIVRARVAIAVGGVFLFTLLLRWAAVGGLGGDDHWSLWTSATFLKGDRPFHEFVDPGDPLYWGMSALAQWVVGYRAIGEVGLGLLLIAFALTQSFRMSWRASGSFVIALGLVVMTAVLVAPTKLYSYPKIFLYPLGTWLAWRYIDRPGLTRACVLALGVAIAFGYRHDHGAYVAVGASVAVLAAHWTNGLRDVAVSLVRVGLATILILSPYFALIQANEGLIPYFKERIRFAAEIDAAGRRAVPFTIDRSAALLVSIPPQTPVPVGVGWVEGTSPERRAALERRFALAPPAVPRVGGPQRYIITDYTEANLSALFAEKALTTVEGIEGAFRRGYALNEPNGTSADSSIRITWREDASASQIAAAERTYSLRVRQSGPGESAARMVTYEIDNQAVENVTALKGDPAVAEILGIHLVRVPVAIRLRDHVPVGPPLSVRWVESVTPAERAALEDRFKLRYGFIRDGDRRQPLWAYDLEDVSVANVTALATSPKATEFDGLEPATSPGTFRTEPWTPPKGGAVTITWSGDVTDDGRRLLEQRYHLEPNTGLPDTMAPYLLLDASPDAIRALASDPNVAAVGGLDAEHGRVPGDSRFTALGRRFAVLRTLPVPRLFLKANAGVWLYYVAYLVPLFVLALLLLDWWCGRTATSMPGEAQKMLTVAALMAVANVALLRKMGYFPDHFDATAIMAAWLLGRAFRGPWRRPAVLAVRVLALVVIGVSTVAASTYVDLPDFGRRYALDATPAAYFANNADKLRAFSTYPPVDHYAPTGVVGDKAIVRYLYDCTQPADRIFVTSDSYAVPYYTQRRVVGHVFWANGFMANEDFERRMIELMERDPVPLVFGVGGERALDNLNLYPRVREYVAKRYTEHHAVLQDNLAGKVFWLLVDSRRTPTSRYEKLGLPCFR